MGDSNKTDKSKKMSKRGRKKEAKLWTEEANSHLKIGNLPKAADCFSKVSSLDWDIILPYFRLLTALKRTLKVQLPYCSS